MKTTESVHQAFYQSSCSSRVRPVGLGMLWLLITLGLTEASETDWGVIRCGEPLSEPLWLDLGTVGVGSPDAPARTSFDRAKGQKYLASDRAGAAACASMNLGVSSPDPLLAIPGNVVGFAAAPVAALVGSTGAGRLSSNQLAECEMILIKAMHEMAQQHHLRDLVMAAARDSTRRELVAMPVQNDPAVRTVAGRMSDGGKVRTVLETAVEELKLERSGSGDKSFRLVIKARARFLRPQSNEVIYDQPFEYRSGKALFLDWTGGDGRSFCLCAETGYRKLARQMVEQVFTKPAGELVLVGRGHQRPPARGHDAPVTLVANRGATHAPSVSEFALRPVMDLGTIGVYPKSSAAYLATQLPLAKEAAVEGALADVVWTLDGLEEHPNLIVTVLADAAAVPLSLYKQTAAAVQGLSEKKFRASEKAVRTASYRLRLDEDLATQLAADLTPRSTQPVVLVKNSRTVYGANAPTRVELANCEIPSASPHAQHVANQPPRRGVNTALEIELLSASLKGGGGVNPRLAFHVEARATMFRVSDGQEIYSSPVHYRSEPRKFAEWAANDAQRLREEMGRCRGELSGAIMHQLVARRLIGLESPRDTLAANAGAQKTIDALHASVNLD